MKKYFLLSFAALLFNLSFGQQLIWNSFTGGDNNNGAVISYDIGQSQLSTLASLEGNFLRGLSINNMDQDFFGSRTFNSGGLISASDGSLYGISSLVGGGAFDGSGAIYKLDPNNSDVEMLHYFPINKLDKNKSVVLDNNYKSFGRKIFHPVLGLVEASNNKIYGIARLGGEYQVGGIYCYDLITGSYEEVAQFDTLANGLGNTPCSPLIEGPNGDLFGVLHTRNNNSEGWLYKIEIATNTVSIVTNLGAAGWAINNPVKQITYNPGENKIYGTKEEFTGLNAGAGIYSYNFNNQTVTNEAIITTAQIGSLGSDGNGVTPIASDGNLYFTTQQAGPTGNGTLLKYNVSTDVVTFVHAFSEVVSGDGMIVSGDYIYGTYDGLVGTSSLIWSYNVSTLQFADVVTSTSVNTIGYLPQHNIALIGNELYGHNVRGIGSNAGSIFKVNTSSNLVSLVQANQSIEGRGLMGEILIEGDSIAYTYIETGGIESSPGHYSEQGGIAKIDLINGTVNLDTTLSKYIYINNGFYKTEKYNRLLKSSSDKYYSSYYTKLPATFSQGCRIRQIDPLTGAYVTIKNASVAKELYTTSAIEYETGKIAFVMGDSLHVYDEGTQLLSSHFLSLNASESAFNNLLLASDGNIYFRTIYHGSGQQTSIYSVDPNTWTSTNIYSFSGVREPNNGLIEVNGKLYGSTLEGGANDEGYLYSIDINNGNTFAIEHSFNADVDGGGFIGEWLAYNGKLYGVSYAGGANGYGTLAEYDLTNGTLTVLEDLDISNGRAYKSGPSLWDDTILAINEFDSELSIKIYPNPTQAVLFIDEAQVESVQIYSLNGKLLLDQKGSSKINVSNLNLGTYILKIINDKGTFSSKFIKE